MSANNLWQDLLADMGTTEEPKQEQVIINPAVRPELQEHYNAQVARIKGETPVPDLSAFSDSEEESEEEESEEEVSLSLELGVVDKPSNNNFELSLPNIPQTNVKPTLDLGLSTSVQPKKVGRPTKVNTAAAVLNEVAQDQDYSKSSTPQMAQATTETKEITVTVPKIKLKEIGESLCRIGNAIIEISKGI